MAPMFDDPYLETCCRAALHRLFLAQPGARPAGKDAPCLDRLSGMGLACADTNGHFRLTNAGRTRHAHEILAPKP